MFYLQTSVIKLPYLAWVFKHNTILEHKRTYIDSAAGQLTVHSATWPSLRAAASNMYVQFTESVSPFPVNVNKDDQQTANTHTHTYWYTLDFVLNSLFFHDDYHVLHLVLLVSLGKLFGNNWVKHLQQDSFTDAQSLRVEALEACQ